MIRGSRTGKRGQMNPPRRELSRDNSDGKVYYPGHDGQFGTPDDLYVENELVLPVGRTHVIELTSRDVIHSFFVPSLRIKQDVVPGMTHTVWFTPRHEGRMEFVCAELCGWGHYRMSGWLSLVSDEQFADYLEQRQALPPADARTEGAEP